MTMTPDEAKAVAVRHLGTFNDGVTATLLTAKALGVSEALCQAIRDTVQTALSGAARELLEKRN